MSQPPQATRSLSDRILRLEQLEVLRCAIYQISDSLEANGRGLALGVTVTAELVTKKQDAMEKVGVIVRQIMEDVSAGRGENPSTGVAPS